MKGILEDKNYPLMYVEVPEGHSWGQWRSQLDDLLIYFFSPNS
jgi:enterochelin esterase family protein